MSPDSIMIDFDPIVVLLLMLGGHLRRRSLKRRHALRRLRGDVEPRRGGSGLSPMQEIQGVPSEFPRGAASETELPRKELR